MPKTNARIEHFCAFALRLLAEDLLGIAQTDSFLRQPDYSSRAVAHYYLILRENAGRKTAAIAHYLQAEFPEFVLNYLTEKELIGYPKHAVWQFQTCPWHSQHPRVKQILANCTSDLPEAMRQAMFGSAHIARLYYLRNLPAQTHVWGVRQLGWAMRFVEYGLCKLLGLHETGHYQIRAVAGIKEEDLGWLTQANNHWPDVEGQLLANVDTFRATAIRLSSMIECYARHIACNNVETQSLIAKIAEPPAETIRALTDPIVKSLTNEFGERLLSLYLHGSAARNEMQPDSDIDAIAVFNQVDENVLARLRHLQGSVDKLSISVYSTDNVRQYPLFRRYGLLNGTRHLAGPWCFSQQMPSTESQHTLLNNIYTLRQVARGYLVAGCFGHRAHYMLSLMVKLADHGCLRPLQQLESHHYAENRAEVMQYFSDCQPACDLLQQASRLAEQEESLKQQLLAGNDNEIRQRWLALDAFATQLEQRARQYLG